MHLAVVGSLESWYLKDLARAAGSEHRITGVTFSDLSSRVAGQGTRVVSYGVDLTNVDAVLVRTMPPGSLEQVVFRMDTLGRLEQSGVVVVNPPRAVEVAVDKYLATSKLAAAGLLVPETITCQTVEDAMQAFEHLGGDAVIKPLFGAEGRGIARVHDEAMALRAAKLITGLGAVVYLQKFIDHEGCDLRMFVAGEKVFGMRRRNHADWRTNVSRGAATETVEVTPELAQLARRAARAVGAPLAGVDLLPGKDGKLYTIEVNAVPGWQALSRTLDLDIAHIVLDFIAQLVADRRVR